MKSKAWGRAAAVGVALFAGIAGAGAPEAAPCPHPWFPIEEGLTLTYRSGKSELDVGFENVNRTDAGLKATLAAKLKDRPATSDASCDAKGISIGMGGLEGTLLGASGMDVKVLAANGVLFPSAVDMVPGKPWTSTLSVEMRPPSGTKMPLGMAPVLKTTFTRTAEVVGEEKITTDAGTFDTLKVKNLTTAAASRNGETRTLESYLWIAKDVGIVKIATGDHVDLELVKLKRKKGKAKK